MIFNPKVVDSRRRLTLDIKVLSATCLILVLWIISTLCASRREGPPELSHAVFDSTRVEMELQPSTLEYFFPGDELKAVLSNEETKRLESLKTIVSSNQKNIQDFSTYDLTMGYYSGQSSGTIAIKNRISLVGYRGDERIISFKMIGPVVRTDDGYEFRYDRGFPHLHLLMPEVWPLALRAGCAANLLRLHAVLSDMAEAKIFPPAAQWCDAVLHYSGELNASPLSGGDGAFECPSARTCHYAMNPVCRPDSPGDLVLLFEAKAGWNLHGGAELFTFDNHDPKGGLVLLNDDTVKFIRTEDELKQLRWK